MSTGSKSSDALDEGTCAVMEASMLEEEGYFDPAASSGAGVTEAGQRRRRLDSLCRVCANASDYFIPIFEGEGAEHQLDMKIQKHLPIQVIEADCLPAQVCYQCASTLIAWHDLVTACVEADKKLHQLLQDNENDIGNHEEKVVEFFNEPPVDSEGDDFNEPSTSTAVVEVRECLPAQKRRISGKGKQHRKANVDNVLSESDVKSSTALSNSTEACADQKEYVESASSTERCRVIALTSLKDFQAHMLLRRGRVCEVAAANSELAPVWVKPEDCYVCSDEMVFQHDERSGVNSLLGKQQMSLSLFAPVGDAGRCRYGWTTHGRGATKKCVSRTECRTGVCSKNSSFRRVANKDEKFSAFHDTGTPEGKKFVENMDREGVKVSDEKEEKIKREAAGDKNAQNSMLGNRKHEHKKLASKCIMYQCTVCGKNFALKDSYFRHMRIHTNERPFTCHVCGKQFRDSGGLSRHLKDVHVGIKNFHCSFCGRSFASKATRDDHHRTHTGERPYVCDSCGKTFRSKASLYIHNKTHSDLFPHVCSTCGKSFRRRQEVVAHVTTHTGEKPHICEQCGKGFRVRSELQRHILIHSDDKPFACATCGLNFKQRRYLRNHERARHAKQISL